jgi:sugar lactone lactonase YvrE
MAPSLSRTLPVWLAALLLPIGCVPEPVLPGGTLPSASPSAAPSESPTPAASPIAEPSQPSASDAPSAAPSAVPSALTATITSVVGVGAKGFYGDGGFKGTEVKMNGPWGIAMSGNDLWIADSGNARIRRYRPDTDSIDTVIGTGTAGFNGDDKTQQAVNLSNPLFVTTSGAGHIYVADTYANRIRRVDVTTARVTTLAGNGSGGFTGDGGEARLATLANPSCVAVGPNETVYIADSGNNAIRRVTSDGTITTVAGTGQAGFSNDGKQGTVAQLRFPEGVITDGAGNVYIADSGNNRIRKLTTAGVLTTIVGDGTQGFAGDGGPATKAKLSRPIGMALAGDGSLYFADAGNRRIRVVAPDGTIRTIAGNGTNAYAGDGGPALLAGFGRPTWVALDAKGNLYVSDSGSGELDQRIRKLTFL